ncbi:hypothetical protein Droror1_Dr00022016 [Drosera rotundifolia]
MLYLRVHHLVEYQESLISITCINLDTRFVQRSPAPSQLTFLAPASSAVPFYSPISSTLHLPTTAFQIPFSFSFSLASLLFISHNLQNLELRISPMEDHKERNATWLSVPQFGDWEQKGEVPDYSLDFSKIRETRKQNKREVSRTSLGNEEEFINPTAPANNTAASSGGYRLVQNNDTPTTRRSFFSYFSCCAKA